MASLVEASTRRRPSGDASTIPAAASANDDPRAHGRVCEGVRHERAADLQDARVVAQAPHGSALLALDLAAGRRRDVLKLAREHRDDAGQVDRLELNRQLAGVDSREIEKVGRELGEPSNLALRERATRDQATRERGEPTVPSTLGLELATNPFLRELAGS